MDDRELLARIRQGGERAFDVVFREHYASLVRCAEAMLHRRDVAEEIVQDVLLALWQRRDALVVEDSLRAYLFRATRNRALNHLRHVAIERRAEPELFAVEVPDAPAPAALIGEEIDVALHTAIATLPPRCREVFELSRVHGLRYAEIAATLAISVKTVEAQMGKALRMLREQLAPWLPDTDADP
ncbi:MAG: RNA polymerase sigma-70 factor [Gemmatimonadaceae bacterium]